uniref:Retinol dehydrogenase 13 n=1 Tax=Suricata suricatta TaxID=37032 RepID=A0A673UMA9_SURSU
MNRYLLPLSVLGTVAGGAVLLRDYVAGGSCPSKATIPGKTVIVTGANTGIGKQTALELAKRGGNVILACRDMEKCEAAAKDIRRETLNHHVNARHLDLASLKSVREFAAKIIEEEEHVHILVNNAAVMRCPHWTTEDGFEMQFGVNHLGHFLLTNLLLDKLKASAPSRVINLSSLAHVAGHIDFEDLNWEKRKYDTKAAYCQSKLAVLLFTKELSRRLQGGCAARLAGLPLPLALRLEPSSWGAGPTGGGRGASTAPEQSRWMRRTHHRVHWCPARRHWVLSPRGALPPRPAPASKPSVLRASGSQPRASWNPCRHLAVSDDSQVVGVGERCCCHVAVGRRKNELTLASRGLKLKSALCTCFSESTGGPALSAQLGGGRHLNVSDPTLSLHFRFPSPGVGGAPQLGYLRPSG